MQSWLPTAKRLEKRLISLKDLHHYLLFIRSSRSWMRRLLSLHCVHTGADRPAGAGRVAEMCTNATHFRKNLAGASIY
jgi:hypothetical protein